MNCVRCDYLLWNLPQCRCPECGLAFETTDYAFPKGAVHFVCPHCEQSYLGTDDRGLPQPRRFDCVGCGHPVDAARMAVRPIEESAAGEPLRFGTAWQRRRRVGLLRGYIDALAQLALNPSEYLRLASANRNDGTLVFSVASAYLAAVVFLGVIVLFRNIGLAAWIPDPSGLLTFPWVIYLAFAVPLAHMAWTYLYGLLIQAVLWSLGQQDCELESSVRAVALGSAVLPAVLLFPPVGLVWYLVVVCSGLEQFHEMPRTRALTAALVPMLVAANALLFVWLSCWVA